MKGRFRVEHRAYCTTREPAGVGVSRIQIRVRVNGKVIAAAQGVLGGPRTWVCANMPYLDPSVGTLGYIEDVHVDPTVRGEGLGLELTKRLARTLKRQGAGEVRLGAVPYEDDSAENRQRLVKFYERAGFCRVREASGIMVLR